MSATIKQIADLSGFSRGTVDRVLNNRGNVNSETSRRIREIAELVGYKPNKAAQALVARRKPIKIGVVIPSEGNEFFDEILNGITGTVEGLSDFGMSVDIKSMKGFKVERQLELIEELVNQKIRALIITPIDDPRIAEKITELSSQGIPVITTNSDIANSGRMCYVGSDYYENGATACALMDKLINKMANVGIVIGSVNMMGHRQRIEGFLQTAADKYKGIKVVKVVEGNDDIIDTYEATKTMLTENTEINAIYLAAAGAQGVCRAVRSLGITGKVRIISVDDGPKTRSLISEGLIDITICQQPFEQGRQPVNIIYDLLVNGIKPSRDCYYTRTEIMIEENL